MTALGRTLRWACHLPLSVHALVALEMCGFLAICLSGLLNIAEGDGRSGQLSARASAVGGAALVGGAAFGLVLFAIGLLREETYTLRVSWPERAPPLRTTSTDSARTRSCSPPSRSAPSPPWLWGCCSS